MRKLREEIKFKESGGITDLFDNQFKAYYNITDEEYDFIAEKATDDELGALVWPHKTFSEIRTALKIRDKYLELFYTQLLNK